MLVRTLTVMTCYYYSLRRLYVCTRHSLTKLGILLVLFFSFFSTSQVFAQGNVVGKVLNDADDSPLQGVKVQIEGTSAGALTNDKGDFTIRSPKPAPLTLVITYVSFDTARVEVPSLGGSVIVRMREGAFTMGPVEIVASAYAEKQKQSSLTVESMGINAIKETPAANFYDGLGHLKGVDLTAASLGFKIVNTRGFNSTAPVRSLQIIDGVDNQSPGLNFSLGNFLGASELDIESVDLIVGASSAFYGPNAFNGVISMQTKNPFIHKGLAASVKVGERNLAEASIRYARAFKNKKGEEKLALKFNVFYLTADDWEAQNATEAYRDTLEARAIPYVGTDNPGGYDAVNRYGDENLNPAQNRATSPNEKINTPGLGRWHRTGYWERDLVNYDTRNLKTNVALHYKLRPRVEMIASSSYSNGTTVFQGDNRISLKGIQFFQHRLEIQEKNKFFVRAYMTHEDAGETYDAVFTAFKLQEDRKNDKDWSQDYRTAYVTQGASSQVRGLEGFPSIPSTPPFIYDFARADSIIDANKEFLGSLHDAVRAEADNNFLQPGTPEFEAAFNDIISRSIADGGTRFIDRSKLYHLHGEYKFKPSFGVITVGANGRLYTPVSDGTIFRDTTEAIRNFEYGVYAGIEKKVADETLKLNATVRMDKNQNFGYLFSPAASAVWTPDENQVIRVSFSSAIRNPTLANQYLYYNVGRAILLGNLDGREDLITVRSLEWYAETFNGDTLEFFGVDPIRPEKVQTIEFGYRATIGTKAYIDASYYFSRYRDFIGFEIGLDVGFTSGLPTDVQAFRIASNAQDIVTTQGASIGINYFLTDKITLNGNYSWNRLNTATDDPIIPAFNTPEHKYNIGITGRDIEIGPIDHVGFSVNYKWIEGFLFEGSPQFTGFIDSYDMLDVQVNKRVEDIYTTFKLGASNVLNNQVYQAYGGPLIGRMAYFSATFDIDKW